MFGRRVGTTEAYEEQGLQEETLKATREDQKFRVLTNSNRCALGGT